MLTVAGNYFLYLLLCGDCSILAVYGSILAVYSSILAVYGSILLGVLIELPVLAGRTRKLG